MCSFRSKELLPHGLPHLFSHVSTVTCNRPKAEAWTEEAQTKPGGTEKDESTNSGLDPGMRSSPLPTILGDGVCNGPTKAALYVTFLVPPYMYQSKPHTHRRLPRKYRRRRQKRRAGLYWSSVYHTERSVQVPRCAWTSVLTRAECEPNHSSVLRSRTRTVLVRLVQVNPDATVVSPKHSMPAARCDWFPVCRFWGPTQALMCTRSWDNPRLSLLMPQSKRMSVASLTCGLSWEDSAARGPGRKAGPRWAIG